MPGKSYFVFLRLYGPFQPWFDKTRADFAPPDACDPTHDAHSRMLDLGWAP